MAYAPHMLVTALGRLGNPGKERFSFSLRLGQPNAAALQHLLDIQPNNVAYADMAEDVRAFFGTAATKISAHAVLEVVKFAKIVPPPAGHPLGKDGKPTPGIYAQDPVVIDVADTPGGVPGALGGIQFVSPASAVAVSLTTPKRGARGRGRFFLPMPVVEQDPANGFLMSVAHAEGIRNSATDLVNNLNNQPGIDAWNGHVVVASTFGTLSSVTGVRVGRVVDTIRSRRGQLSESYTAGTNIVP
jgi:hypothetical protein